MHIAAIEDVDGRSIIHRINHLEFEHAKDRISDSPRSKMLPSWFEYGDASLEDKCDLVENRCHALR